MMTDSELERIALTDATGLRPEVFEIIAREIHKRNLNIDLLKGALAQNKTFSAQEVEEYSKYLRSLPCPVCNQKNQPLNGTTSYFIKSFVFFTSYHSEITIACPDCLRKKNVNAIWSSALLGWWGFPWGLLKTPQYIFLNIRAMQKNRLIHSNDSLLSFTSANIGTIEAFKDDTERLNRLISGT